MPAFAFSKYPRGARGAEGPPPSTQALPHPESPTP